MDFRFSPLVLVATLLTGSVAVASDRYDKACSTNIYLVEKREYRTEAGVIPVDVVPSEVPGSIANLFDQLQRIPVNISDEALKAYFTTAPKVEEVEGSGTRYIWHSQHGKREEYLTLEKQQGCVAQIVLSYRHPDMKSKGRFESLIQDNLLPEPTIISLKEERVKTCDYSMIESQRYQHRVNGWPRYAAQGRLPEFGLEMFRKYRLSALHDAGGSLLDLGAPERDLGVLRWQLRGPDKQVYAVKVTTMDACDRELSISWKDERGVTHELLRENEFLIR